MRKFEVRIATRVRGKFGGTETDAHVVLERLLNDLRQQGHSIQFITVNSMNEYTVVSLPGADSGA